MTPNNLLTDILGTLTPEDQNISLDDIFAPLGEVLNVGVIAFDMQDRVIYSNENAAKTLGLPAEVISKGKKTNEIIKHINTLEFFGESLNPEIIDQLLSAFSAAKLAQKTAKKEWEYKREDGETLNISSIVTAEGRLIIYIENITQAARTTDIMESAFSIGDAGYWTYTFSDNQFKFSKNIQDSLTQDELKCINEAGLWSIIHPDDVKLTKRAWQKAFANRENMDFTYRVIGEKIGTRHFRNVGTPEYSTTGKPIGVVCFIYDVTHHYQAQTALREAKEATEKSLQANNQFLAQLSHEVRTPMNGIMGMTDALLNNPAHAGAADHLKVIQSSSESLLRVVNDTLEHAKLTNTVIEVKNVATSPHDILTKIHHLWAHKAKANGTSVQLQLDSSLPETLLMDPFRYEQCINNLMSNAVKFTKNGNIRLVATMVMKQNQFSFVTVVKDTGIGMSLEQQEQVFVPYMQADQSISSRYGGTGLGMAITKNLVELMSGQIQLQSALDGGTTFAIFLPVTVDKKMDTSPAPQVLDLAPSEATSKSAVVEPAAKTEVALNTLDITAPHLKSGQMPLTPQGTATHPKSLTANAPAGNERISRLKVLIVDDNAINQLVIKSLLEPYVGEMQCAANGQEAIDMLAVHPIDIVLMDIHMPIMDGIEATLKIRSEPSAFINVPIIALTADPEYQQIRICKNVGMDDALSKPVNLKLLLEAIDTVVMSRESTSNLSAAS